MNTSDYLAILALIISVISLIISWYFGFRDRAHIKTFSELIYYHGSEIPNLKIKIINKGRRPIYLVTLGSELDDGSNKSNRLGNDNNGLKLGENEKYEIEKKNKDVTYVDPYGKLRELVNFWIEDSLGRKYIIKDSEKNIKYLQ